MGRGDENGWGVGGWREIKFYHRGTVTQGLIQRVSFLGGVGRKWECEMEVTRGNLGALSLLGLRLFVG